jgi:hypothetical protein
MYFFTILSKVMLCIVPITYAYVILGLPLVTSLLCRVNLSRLCHQWSSFQMASHVRYANITLSKKSKLKNQAFYIGKHRALSSIHFAFSGLLLSLLLATNCQPLAFVSFCFFEKQGKYSNYTNKMVPKSFFKVYVL